MKNIISFGLLVIISLIFSTGCNNKNKEEKILTIGFCIIGADHIPIMDGFKSGMNELGHIEGKNIRYIYNGIPENNQDSIDKAINKLISQDVDMLLVTTGSVALRAKKAVEGKNISIIFAAASGTVKNGLVKSISNPGRGITGVEMSSSLSKLIELLLQMRPETKKIYIPYNPEDNISIINSSRLDNVASQFGITFVKKEVHTVEEATAAIDNLPKDFDAILRMASTTLDPRNSELSQAAIRRGIPMVASLPLDDSVLLTLSTDPFKMGKQAARLADQMKAGNMEDIPVEMSDLNLVVNVTTANKIGIKVPDGILIIANKIVR